MYARRHPYLFFLLVFTSITSLLILFSLVLIHASIKSYGLTVHGPRTGQKVGVIQINGLIVDAGHIIDNLKRFREDNSIKAIVLRIDTPGGGVGPAQEIYREVIKTTGKKKIITSMGSMAASGGYYIAAGSDGIVANPGTMTGSIGAVINFTNFRETLEKIGLYPVVVKSGDYKDIGSPTRKMTEEEQAILQAMVDKIHHQFISAIAAGRKMAPEKVAALADGRIIIGEDALALGLVDRLGNMEDAIEWAGRLGGIEGDILPVYAREKKMSLINSLLDSSAEALFRQVDRFVARTRLEAPKLQ